MSTPTCNTCAYRSNNLIVLMFCSEAIECNRPNRHIDLVTGQPQQAFCNTERKYEHRCGPDGHFHSSVFPIKQAAA